MWRKFQGLRTVTLYDAVLACRRAQILGMLTDTIILAHRRTPFWHVDGDKLVWHVDGNNPVEILLSSHRLSHCFCVRPVLHPTCCLQTPSFWHIDDHSVGISTETIIFGMSTENFFACRREQSFLHVDGDNLVWHVDGIIFLHVNGDNLLWHVDGNIFLHVDGGNLFCMSTKTISSGMSTETIFFACRRRQPFWHVDGRFGMSTRRIPVLVMMVMLV